MKKKTAIIVISALAAVVVVLVIYSFVTKRKIASILAGVPKKGDKMSTIYTTVMPAGYSDWFVWNGYAWVYRTWIDNLNGDGTGGWKHHETLDEPQIKVMSYTFKFDDNTGDYILI